MCGLNRPMSIIFFLNDSRLDGKTEPEMNGKLEVNTLGIMDYRHPLLEIHWRLNELGPEVSSVMMRQ